MLRTAPGGVLVAINKADNEKRELDVKGRQASEIEQRIAGTQRELQQLESEGIARELQPGHGPPGYGQPGYDLPSSRAAIARSPVSFADVPVFATMFSIPREVISVST